MKRKIVTGQSASSLKDWQARFSTEWARYVQTAAFQAGMQFLRNRKLESVANLNDEQIEKNGRELLADLRGFLQHETELLKLHEMTEFTLPFEEPDVYVSPEQEAEHEQLVAKFQKENEKRRHAH